MSPGVPQPVGYLLLWRVASLVTLFPETLHVLLPSLSECQLGPWPRHHSHPVLLFTHAHTWRLAGSSEGRCREDTCCS